MKRLLALLLLLATPAFAGNDETPTILRGTPAPPQPAYQPPPQPVVVQVPVYQPVYYFYALPVRRVPALHHHHRSRH
jgi:hypothetical protein